MATIHYYCSSLETSNCLPFAHLLGAFLDSLVSGLLGHCISHQGTTKRGSELRSYYFSFLVYLLEVGV